MLVGGEPKKESSVGGTEDAIEAFPNPIAAEWIDPTELPSDSPFEEEVERDKSALLWLREGVDGVGLINPLPPPPLRDGLSGSSLSSLSPLGWSLCLLFALDGAIGLECRKEEDNFALSALPPAEEGGR